MNILVRVICSLVLLASVAVFPYLSLGIAFGLAGSSARFFLMVVLGYVGLVLSCVASLWRPRYYKAVIVSLCLLWAGFSLDSKNRKNQNEQYCLELRANPTCVESVTGFDCENVDGAMLVTSNICPDPRDSPLAIARKKAAEENVRQVENQFRSKTLGTCTGVSFREDGGAWSSVAKEVTRQFCEEQYERELKDANCGKQLDPLSPGSKVIRIQANYGSDRNVQKDPGPEYSVIGVFQCP